MQNEYDKFISKRTIVNDTNFSVSLLKEDNKALLESIEMITEELDHLSVLNKSYIDQSDSDTKTILNLFRELEELEKENKELKAVANLSAFELFENLSPELINIRTEMNDNESEVMLKKDSKFFQNNTRNERNNANFDFSSISCFSNNKNFNDNSTIFYTFK